MKKTTFLLRTFIVSVLMLTTISSFAEVTKNQSYTYTYGNLIYEIISNDETSYAKVIGLKEDAQNAKSIHIQKKVDGIPVLFIKEYAFKDKSELESVIIGNKIKEIGMGAFKNCTALTEITIPNSVTDIEGYVFDGCTSLQTCNLWSSDIYIQGDAFLNCPSLENIIVWDNTANNEYYILDYDGILFAYQGAYYTNSLVLGVIKYPMAKEGTHYKIPHFTEVIENIAFRGAKLTSVDIPSTIRRIGNGAFEGSSLTEVVIPKNSHLSTSIETAVNLGFSAFANCPNLQSVTIPRLGFETGRFVFKDCPSLTEIHLRATYAEIQEAPFIYEGLFEEFNKSQCTLFVPANQVNAYQSSQFFSDFKEIKAEPTEIAVGDRIMQDEIEYQVITSNAVKVVKSSLSPEVTTLNIPEKVEKESQEFTVTTIGTGIFVPINSGNNSGDDFNVVSQTRQLVNQSSENNVTTIIIPKTVTCIEDSAFTNCPSLTSVTCLIEDINNLTMGDDVFKGVDKSNCTLSIPENKTNDYNNAEQWQDFNNVVEVENSTTDVKSLTVTNTVSVIGKNIIVSNNKNEQVKLYDISGKVIYNIPFAKQNLTLQVKKSGVYVLQVNNSTQKVIVR